MSAAKELHVCPSCNEQKYALSAYNEEGIEKLRNAISGRGGEAELAGSWYCTPGGELQQW